LKEGCQKEEGENFFEKRTDNPPSSIILLPIVRSFLSYFLFGKKTDNSPSSIILQTRPSFPLPSKPPHPKIIFFILFYFLNLKYKQGCGFASTGIQDIYESGKACTKEGDEKEGSPEG